MVNAPIDKSDEPIRGLARSSRVPIGPQPPTRLTRSLLGVCLVLAVLYLARDLLIPIALAIFFSFLLAPLVRAVQSRGLPRIPSVVVVATLSISLLSAGGWFVGSQAVGLFQDLPAYRDNIVEKVRGLRESIGGKVRPFTQTIDVVTKEISQPATEPASGGPIEHPAVPLAEASQAAQSTPTASSVDQLRLLRATIFPLLHPFEILGLTAVFLFFFLAYREDLRDRIIWLCGRAHLSLTTAALTDAGARVSRYFGGLVLANGLHGLAVTLGLAAMGIPNPLVFGVIAALLRFIPFLGPTVAAILPSTLALAIFDGWARPIMVICLFVFVDVLSANLLEPWLYGARTGASATAIILSTVLWTWLWGGIGLVLATPITVCLVVLGKYVPQFQTLYVVLGDEPVLEPHARLYQRLLATDRAESLFIIRTALKADRPETVMSNLVVPALSLLAADGSRGAHDVTRQAIAARIIDDVLAPHAPQTKESTPADRLRSAAGTSSAPCVLVMPVHGPHDEVAARILVRLRESRGAACRVASPHLLFAELLATIRANRPAAICLATVRADNAARIDLLCRRIADDSMECPIVVGVWDLSVNANRACRRLARYPGVRCSGTLAETNRALDVFQPRKAPADPPTVPPADPGLLSPVLAGFGQ